jgi:hypothetical protein
MGEVTGGGLGRRVFATSVVGIVALVIAQSIVHLFMVLRLDRIGTLVDLDRSNGLPDLVSTLALVVAAVGAIVVGRDGARSSLALSLAALLGGLAVADLFHDGPHPSAGGGWYVIVLAVATGALLTVAGIRFGLRPRATLVAAAIFLAGSFLVNGLDRVDQWFERERSDPIAEYQIVAKEGLELLGWSLVALALWDEALRRRAQVTSTTARASRAQAPSRRRAA